MNPAIEDYEFLSVHHGQMCAAATEGEWDRLVALEKQCSQRVALMKAQAAAATARRAVRGYGKLHLDPQNSCRRHQDSQLAPSLGWRNYSISYKAPDKRGLLEAYFKH